MHEAYLILLNPSFPELHGWEVSVNCTNGPLVDLSQTTEIYGGGINHGSDLEMRVDYEVPLETSEITVLAKVWVVSVYDEECFYLTGISDPSLEGPDPLVFPEADSPVPIDTLDLYDNGIDAVVGTCASVGYPSYYSCEDAVTASRMSWGSLKAEYR